MAIIKECFIKNTFKTEKRVEERKRGMYLCYVLNPISNNTVNNSAQIHI